jgi:Tfp pilus assembly protein PilN
MKAVNLIPRDAPRHGRGSGGMGAYVLLALLALAVVVAGANAFTGRRLADERAKLARAESSARSAELKAAALQLGSAEALSGKARVETIAALIDGRFDWSTSLKEVARAVPSDISLTSLVGTATPNTQIASGGGATLRGALPVPAVDLIGCAPSHGRVATLLTRLRAIDGVQRVTLASSEKSDSSGANDTDCRANDKMPQFQLTVFYDAPEGLVPAVDAVDPAAPDAAAAAAATPGAPDGGAR